MIIRRELLQAVLPATSSDNTRYYLKGVQVDPAKHTATATDGHVLLIATDTAPFPDEDFPAVPGAEYRSRGRPGARSFRGFRCHPRRLVKAYEGFLLTGDQPSPFILRRRGRRRAPDREDRRARSATREDQGGECRLPHCAPRGTQGDHEYVPPRSGHAAPSVRAAKPERKPEPTSGTPEVFERIRQWAARSSPDCGRADRHSTSWTDHHGRHDDTEPTRQGTETGFGMSTETSPRHDRY